jgi:hypothetical protein
VVVPVNQRSVQFDGNWIVRTSVELWDDCCVLRFVHEDRNWVDPSAREPGPRSRHEPLFSWRLTDDIGAEYQRDTAGAGSGLDPRSMGFVRFTPAIAPDASALRIFAPGIEPEASIDVPLP